MKGRDVADLLLLGALWGASFLFMRVAVPQFGPLPLMAVRCGVGAAVLLPLLAWRGQLEALRPNAGRLLTVGVLNSALPFALFAYATLSLTAGFTALLNSTVPIWGRWSPMPGSATCRRGASARAWRSASRACCCWSATGSPSAPRGIASR